MSNEVIVYKSCVTDKIINMGIDVSGDTFESEIRSKPTKDATLIVAWTVTTVTDGTDGLLKITIDDTDDAIDAEKGYMDLKRVVAGNRIPVFDTPLEVAFRDAVTA